MVCLNGNETARIGKGRLFTILPLGKVELTWSHDELWESSCVGRPWGRSDSKLYNGFIHAYTLNIKTEGHFLWRVGQDATLKGPSWGTNTLRDFPITGVYYTHSSMLLALKEKNQDKAYIQPTIQKSREIEFDKKRKKFRALE